MFADRRRAGGDDFVRPPPGCVSIILYYDALGPEKRACVCELNPAGLNLKLWRRQTGSAFMLGVLINPNVAAHHRRLHAMGGAEGETSARARARNDARGSATERERLRGQSVNAVHANRTCLLRLVSRLTSVVHDFLRDKVFPRAPTFASYRLLVPTVSRVVPRPKTYIYVAVQIPVQMCGRTIEEMTSAAISRLRTTGHRSSPIACNWLLMLLLLGLATASSRASDSCDWSGR